MIITSAFQDMGNQFGPLLKRSFNFKGHKGAIIFSIIIIETEKKKSPSSSSSKKKKLHVRFWGEGSCPL